MVFSFYYTEEIATLVLNKNPLMIKINNEKNNYNIKSVNAIIDGNYIITVRNFNIRLANIVKIIFNDVKKAGLVLNRR